MNHESFQLRAATSADAEVIARIYNHYITKTVITFEEIEVESTEMARRIDAVQEAALPWLVAEQDGTVCGYAYASPWNPRSAYRFAAEVTAYVDASRCSRGIGSTLYRELIKSLESLGYHTAIGGIALPNEASVRLHERCGFSKVAHYAEVGYKFGRHIDVGYWQLMLGKPTPSP